MNCRPVLICCFLTVVAGCRGPQSTLDPGGSGAQAVAELTAWLGIGALLIWLAVIGIAFYAMQLARTRNHSERAARLFIVIGGVVIPVVVLTGLLAYSLSMTPALLARGDGLELDVVGEQYWWRVRYRLPDGSSFETANEIRLPVDRRVDVHLTTADVIHSFWIPSLAGKVDMLPGRENRLTLEPTRVGVYRGVCAEFCGTSHGLMAFDVIVMSAADFAAWTAAQPLPASSPTAALARRGAELFLANGCGACHRISGTAADGTIGPDLSHVGSRRTLAAATLPMSRENTVRWLKHAERIKPDVAMPTYDMLEESELLAIASYLEALN